MPATKEDLFARLAELGIKSVTTEHPPLFTVEQSQALRGRIAGPHTKNLLLRDKKKERIILVVAHEDAAIDLKRFHTLVGCARLSFASPELLMETLGVPPGSVTPFALINDAEHRVELIVDEALLRNDILNFHPLTNDATTTIAREDFLRFLDSCSHPPRVMALSQPRASDG
jgi:Ala-tRNA(Pro) deacylase